MHKEKTEKKVDSQKTLKRILLYIRPYTALVILSLLLSALTVGLTLYIPILTGRGVDYIVGEGQVDFVGIFKKLNELNYHGMFLIEMWADNSADQTVEQATEKIADAYRFVTDKMKQAGMEI